MIFVVDATLATAVDVVTEPVKAFVIAVAIYAVIDVAKNVLAVYVIFFEKGQPSVGLF